MSNSVIECDSTNKLGLSSIERDEQENWEACHPLRCIFIFILISITA